jgi:hypothetical protein
LQQVQFHNLQGAVLPGPAAARHAEGEIKIADSGAKKKPASDKWIVVIRINQIA